MRKKELFRIGHDCDGVLADSNDPVLYEVNQILGTNLTKKDLTRWDAVSVKVQEMTGDEKLAAHLEANWFDPAVLRRSPPNPALLEVFNRCRKLPHTEQFIITTRRPACYLSTRDWLEEHIPLDNDGWRTYLRIRRKNNGLGGDDFKVKELKKWGIIFMTEDNTQTIARISAEVPQCRVAYVTQPWNESDKDPDRAKLRVPSDDPNVLFDRILAAREEFFSKNL